MLKNICLTFRTKCLLVLLISPKAATTSALTIVFPTTRLSNGFMKKPVWMTILGGHSLAAFRNSLKWILAHFGNSSLVAAEAF
jgi:hypothetical protein